MSPEEKAAHVKAMLSVSNEQLAGTAIEQQIEHLAGTLLAFVQPRHHAEICAAIARAALKRANEQDPNAAAWAGRMLEIYRHHAQGGVS